MEKIDDAILLQLLEKSRQGNLLPEEEKLLESWFTSLQKTDAPWYKDKADEAVQLDALWQSIHERTRPVTKHRTLYKYWWAAAAVLTGMVLLAVWITPQKQHAPVVQSLPREQPAIIAAVNSLTVTARLGTVKKVTLPDNSIVMLNSGASIRYPEKFDGRERKVFLMKGQAFFEVTKDDLHPFIVHSEGLQTQVLGTSFEINIKPGKQVIVSVATGKVKVNNGGHMELGRLLPGKRLTYAAKSEKTSITDFDKKIIAQWRSKQIKLEQASFAALSEAFFTIYGVQLKAANSLVKEQTYTITLQYNTSMKDMMGVLSAIHNNEYSIHNNTVTLKQKTL